MKQYEVPYNFAYDFYTKLSRRADLFPYVKCIYLPSYSCLRRLTSGAYRIEMNGKDMSPSSISTAK